MAVALSACLALAAIMSSCLRSGGNVTENESIDGTSVPADDNTDNAAAADENFGIGSETESITSDTISNTDSEELQTAESVSEIETTVTEATVTTQRPAHSMENESSAALSETASSSTDVPPVADTYRTEPSPPAQTEVKKTTAAAVTEAPQTVSTETPQDIVFSSASRSEVPVSSDAVTSETAENAAATTGTITTTVPETAVPAEEDVKTVTLTATVPPETTTVQTSADNDTDESITETEALLSQESSAAESSAAETVSSETIVSEEMPSGAEDLYSPVFDTDVIAKAVYIPESITSGTVSAYYDRVVISGIVQINELISILSNVEYREMSDEEISAEESAIELWSENHSGYAVTAESLSFCDSSGRELMRFESDTRTAVACGSAVTYFSRLITGNKQYIIYSGSIYRGGILSLVTSHVLEENDLLTADELSEIARRQVAEYLYDFESIDPVCEIYTPNSVIITVDGELLSPESFKEGEKLCDCVFSYADGNKMIVTLNARTGKVYQVKMEPVIAY